MALEGKNLFFRYDQKKPWILEDVSIKIEKGQRLAVSAPSGYGKTTLALLLAGYLKPVKGEILLDGRPLPRKGFCPVQLIYQHPEKAINPRWRLRRILEESGQRKEEVLDAFGIERNWLDRFPAASCRDFVSRELCFAVRIISSATRSAPCWMQLPRPSSGR